MTEADIHSTYYSNLPKFEYLEARTVGEACSLLKKYGDRAKIIAGGTDLLVSMKKRNITPWYIINIKNIPDLEYIQYDNEKGLKIGALTALESIESSPMIRERFFIVADAAHQIGSPQIRNWATIGGNLCNAAPSADMALPLIGLGAMVKIEGINGEKVFPIEQFFIGPGINVLETGEILTEIQVPTSSLHTGGAYLKLPSRTSIDIAVVGVAVVLTLNSEHRRVLDARIVLGAVAPIPMRAHKAENIIKGKVIEEQLIVRAAQTAAEEARPISDIRGSAKYRKEMVRVLTNLVIRQAIGSTS